MKLGMTWGDVAAATQGRIARGQASAPFQTFSTDSRTLEAGQAFWALRGEKFDAHDFLDSGLAARAAGWIVARGRAAATGPLPPQVLEVEDTLAALQALARIHRRRSSAAVAAITGSNGKTTTKEMLRSICGRLGPTCATIGNFNNQLGLPLSLLELSPEHRYGIFEMGASRPGEIRELAAIAEPGVGVLTNIGPAHLEHFGSLEATFAAKCELLEGLPPDGPVALNADDPFLSRLAGPLAARAVTFGKGASNVVRILGPGLLKVNGAELRLPDLFGNLSLYNAAAAAAAALALGAGMDAIREGLGIYHPPAMRLERRRHPSGALIVLDAYNANPASMRAAVEAFCAQYPDRRRVAVLGDMKELGAHSARYHRELGCWLAGLPLAAVYLAGREIRPAHEALVAAGKTNAHWSEDPRGSVPLLKPELKEGTALFLKASRAMRFEDLLAELG